MVQFGHNDNHGKERPESTDAKTDYKDYLRQYVKAFKKTGTKVIFVTPMCRMTFRKDGTLADRLQPYADAMKEVAVEQHCPVLDLHSASKKLFTKTGSDKCVGIYGVRSEDRSHFSEKGAEEMVKIIIKELKRSGSPLVEYIKK